MSPKEPRRDQDALCEIDGAEPHGQGLGRQVVEIQTRIAVLNRYTSLGIPATQAVGKVRRGKGNATVSGFVQQSHGNG